MRNMDSVERENAIKDIVEDIDKLPCIIVYDDIIKSISISFANLVEFSIKELMNKNIKEMLKELRVGPNINIEKINEDVTYFLFSKSLKVRFVTIEIIEKVNQQVYIFREKPNSRFEDNNQFLERYISENKIGIGVFTASDYVLIKANQAYLDNYPAPYNTPEAFYGESLKDHVTNFKNSRIKQLLDDTAANNKSQYYKDIKCPIEGKGDIYWNYSLIPVAVNNEVQYIISTIENVTSHVINRKRIKKQSEMLEQRNKQLEAIFESIDDAIFIYGADRNYYMVNKSAKEYFLNNKMKSIADVYDSYEYYDKDGNKISLENMPVSRLFSGEIIRNERMTLKNDIITKHVSVNGRAIYDSNGNIKFAVICSRDVTQGVNARKIIENQKNELEAIIESIGDFLFIVDREGNVHRQNEAGNKVFRKLISKSGIFTDFNNNVLSIKETPCYKVLHKGKKIKDFKIKIIGNKVDKYNVINGTPIFDSNGEVKLGVFATLDITDLMENKKQLKKQKDLLENIINNTSNGIIMFNKTGKQLIINDAAKKLFCSENSIGSLDSIIADNEYFHENGEAVAREQIPINRAINGEIINGERFLIKQENRVLVLEFNSSIIHDNDGNIDMIIIYTHDLTKVIGQNKIIKRQKEQLEAIINNMEEAIFVIDKEGDFLIKNNIARKLLGPSIKNADDFHNLKKIFHIDGSRVTPEEMPFYYLLHGRSLKGQIVYFEAKGQKEYMIINTVPINDYKGDFVYGIITTLGITDLMQSQQDLKFAQEQLLKVEREKNETLEKALEMKDDFLALVSHEFRTPINVISTAIQALTYIYGNQFSDKVKVYINTIRQNNFRQLRLVNNLLDITRAKAGRIKMDKKNIDIVFLTKAITESVHDYAAQKGVNVSFTSSFKKKIIALDDEKYERIILNLISNAIKFTSEDNNIYVTLRSVKGRICVEVKDTGIGIPSDKIDVIFDKFGQVDSSLSRQAEGTGIGLSLVKMFVKALGGSISVKSKIGKGSTFTVLLPNERITEEQSDSKLTNFMNNHLVEVTNVEFSDIYL